MSSTLRAVGAFSGNNARCTSSDEYRPARRTTTLSPASSHSRTEPGPTPSIRRTSAGTEICPCAVTFECASAMALSYHGNAHPARFPHISPRVVSFERRMALPAGIPACGHSRLRAFPFSEGIYEIGSGFRDLLGRCPATWWASSTAAAPPPMVAGTTALGGDRSGANPGVPRRRTFCGGRVHTLVRPGPQAGEHATVAGAPIAWQPPPAIEERSSRTRRSERVSRLVDRAQPRSTSLAVARRIFRGPTRRNRTFCTRSAVRPQHVF